MRKIFRTDEKTKPFFQVPDSIIKRVVNATTRQQEALAEWMQRKTEALTAPARKQVFILFCLSGTLCSLYSIIGSFRGSPVKMIRVTAIRTPGYSTLTGEEKLRHNTTADQDVIQQIRHFNIYMDSLDKTGAGRQKADSIRRLRKGLTDSIFQLELMYKMQTPLNK